MYLRTVQTDRCILQREQLALESTDNFVLDPHVNWHEEEVEAGQAAQDEAQQKHHHVGPVLAQLLVRLFCLGSQLQRRLSKLQA